MKQLAPLLGAALICSQAHAGWFGRDTFETCVLDKMPGVANSLAAKLVLADCTSYPRAEAGSGRGLLSKYNSGAACFAEKGKSVGDQLGAAYVYGACNLLYDEPGIDPSKVIPDPSPSK